ncbi:MAG: hypothetical protein E7469_00590 [Ruminococcaceae bacterium]|nr:hypothetical protein [Oscillospiraceae bacterium]
MEEKDIVMTEATEETVQQPAWEVVPDPVNLDAVEEKLEEVEEAVEEVLDDAEEELKRGVAAVKEWLSNTLYEAGRVFQEHKIAILAIIGAIATAVTVAGIVFAVLKKKK